MKTDRNKRLEALSRLKAGYVDNEIGNEDDLVFDEIEENEYLNKKQTNHAEDDFIEDDDGNGYVDYGQDEWDAEAENSDDEKYEKKQSGSKRKLKSSVETSTRKKHQITSLFQKASMQSSKKAVKKLNINDHKDDAELLESIFSALDDEVKTEETPVKIESDATLTKDFDDDVVIKTEPVIDISVKQEVVDDIVIKEELIEHSLETAENVKEENSLKSLGSIPNNWSKKDSVLDGVAANSTFGNTTLSSTDPLSIYRQCKVSTDKPVEFFYCDAADRDGVVYLFGKVWCEQSNAFVSASIVVNNMQRNVFVLPKRQPLDDADEDQLFLELHQEIDRVRKSQGVPEFKSKMVTRKYCFELPDIPREARYMKVVYSYKYPALNAALLAENGPVKHMFGAQSSALERFLVKRRIMGPAWLSISNASMVTNIYNGRMTWCSVELSVNSMKDISVAQEQSKHVPLTALVLQAHTVQSGDGKSEEYARQVVMVSGTVYDGVSIDESLDNLKTASFCLAAPPKGTSLPLNVPFMQEWTSDISKLEGLKGYHNFSLWYSSNQSLSKGTKLPFCYKTPSESVLLEHLVSIIGTVDPDIIVGHYLIDGLRETLFRRMQENKVRNITLLGRFIRVPHMNFSLKTGNRANFASIGRLWSDTYLAAQDMVKVDNYSLQELVRTQLQQALPPIEIDSIRKYFATSASLEQLVLSTHRSLELTFALLNHLQVLPLTRQLTNLAGNLWRRTLGNARAERNEYLLLHEFHRQKYIVPDKALFKAEKQQPTRKTKHKPQYAGGLVLEPKKGFYEHYVLLLDFNSLYPSIIREYNIDFTTVSRTKAVEEDGEIPIPSIPAKDLPQGVLPKLLSSLVDRRRQVKLLLQTETNAVKRAQLDIRQKALKLTANSMYGCLGAEISRFYAKPLAMLITSCGRTILQDTVDLASREHELDVVYGDTDSIMIATHSSSLQQAHLISDTIRKAVNSRYQMLELGLDGIFRKLLLVQKKMYAALLIDSVSADGTEITFKRETKGLNVVRRDWCALSRTVCLRILDEMMPATGESESGDFVDRVSKILCDVGDDVRAGRVALDAFIINKGLTKSIEHYNSGGELPAHVKVAMAMREQTGRNPQIGDTIPYIVCVSANGNSGSLGDKSKHASMVKSIDEVDLEWYLSNQVLPPVSRILNPIEGFGELRAASCLGLDVANISLRSTSRSHLNFHNISSDERLESQMADDVLFQDALQFSVRCPHCKNKQKWGGVYTMKGELPMSSFVCLSCSKILPVNSLQYQLCRSIQVQIHMYQQNWLVCDDPLCRNETTFVGAYGLSCLVPGCCGTMHPKYSSAILDRQLHYFESLFDVCRYRSRAESLLPTADRLLVNDARNLQVLLELVKRYSSKSQRRYVDLERLFLPLKNSIKA